RGMLPPAATVPFGPLWFLAVYVVVVAISPITIAMHRRFRWWVPAILAAGAVGADVIGFGFGISGARYANIAFVLLFPHQLGHFYADGSFPRLPRKVFWGMALGGFAALLVLTNPILVTLFLWHMTAYLLAILVMWPLGFGHQHATSARWWLERPLWIVVPGLVLAAIVAVVARFERASILGNRHGCSSRSR